MKSSLAAGILGIVGAFALVAGCGDDDAITPPGNGGSAGSSGNAGAGGSGTSGSAGEGGSAGAAGTAGSAGASGSAGSAGAAGSAGSGGSGGDGGSGGGEPDAGPDGGGDPDAGPTLRSIVEICDDKCSLQLVFQDSGEAPDGGGGTCEVFDPGECFVACATDFEFPFPDCLQWRAFQQCQVDADDWVCGGTPEGVQPNPAVCGPEGAALGACGPE